MHYVLIAGGRNYEDRETITEKLDSLIQGTDVCIVEGGARGVDSIAKEYAESRGMEIREFKPEWKKYGKAAGPLRNTTMCEFVREMGGEAIYFWDGKSKGTGDCIKTAKKLGLPVTIWNYAAEEMIRYNSLTKELAFYFESRQPED